MQYHHFFLIVSVQDAAGGKLIEQNKKNFSVTLQAAIGSTHAVQATSKSTPEII
jgi:hypothetical protein